MASRGGKKELYGRLRGKNADSAHALSSKEISIEPNFVDE